MGLVVLAWVFSALLLMLVVVCLAAGRGAIPRNHFIGVRIPALKRSDAAWRAGHAAGAIPAVVASVIGLASSALGLVAPVACWGSIAAFAVGLVWVFVMASKAANAS